MCFHAAPLLCNPCLGIGRGWEWADLSRMAVGNAHLYAKCPVFIGDDTIRRFGMGVCCLASAHDSLTIGDHLNQQHLTRGDSEKRSAAIV